MKALALLLVLVAEARAQQPPPAPVPPAPVSVTQCPFEAKNERLPWHRVSPEIVYNSTPDETYYCIRPGIWLTIPGELAPDGVAAGPDSIQFTIEGRIHDRIYSVRNDAIDSAVLTIRARNRDKIHIMDIASYIIRNDRAGSSTAYSLLHYYPRSDSAEEVMSILSTLARGSTPYRLSLAPLRSFVETAVERWRPERDRCAATCWIEFSFPNDREIERFAKTARANILRRYHTGAPAKNVCGAATDWAKALVVVRLHSFAGDQSYDCNAMALYRDNWSDPEEKDETTLIPLRLPTRAP